MEPIIVYPIAYALPGIVVARALVFLNRQVRGRRTSRDEALFTVLFWPLVVGAVAIYVVFAGVSQYAGSLMRSLRDMSSSD